MNGGAPFSPERRALLHGGRDIGAPLRPPWAIAESAFVETCNGCGDCVPACPEHVLKRGDGGLPIYDPARGECLFCAACAKACGAGAFGATDEEPWAIKARIDTSCLARNGVTCFACRDACGEAAICFVPRIGGAHPELDPSRCTGCGACVGVCPVAAIALAVPEAMHG